MKHKYISPSINISVFESENILIALSGGDPNAVTRTVSAYGMQDFSTLQKVKHEIEAGSPTVGNILKYHVH